MFSSFSMEKEDLREHLISDVDRDGNHNVEGDEIFDGTYSHLDANGSSNLVTDVESLKDSEVPAYILRYLYAGHFLARWGTRFLAAYCIVWCCGGCIYCNFWSHYWRLD